MACSALGMECMISSGWDILLLTFSGTCKWDIEQEVIYKDGH